MAQELKKGVMVKLNGKTYPVVELMMINPKDTAKVSTGLTSLPVQAGPVGKSLVSAIADAIDRMEGPGVQNNNPGNIRTWGNLPTRNGFAVFPTLEEGRRALERQIQLNINRGLNLQEFFGGKPGVYAGYAPSADRNNPEAYANNVAQWTGIPVDQKLDQLQPVYDAGVNIRQVPGLATEITPVVAEGDAFGFTTESTPTLAYNGAVLLLLLGAAVAVANQD